MGELLPVASTERNGLLRKENSIISCLGSNKCTKFSYEYKNLVRLVLIGMYQIAGKSNFISISLSKSQYGSNFEVISSKDLTNNLVKYLITDTTLDFYIENGNIELIQFGLNGDIKLMSTSIVDKSEVPIEAFDLIKRQIK